MDKLRTRPARAVAKRRRVRADAAAQAVPQRAVRGQQRAPSATADAAATKQRRAAAHRVGASQAAEESSDAGAQVGAHGALEQAVAAAGEAAHCGLDSGGDRGLDVLGDLQLGRAVTENISGIVSDGAQVAAALQGRAADERNCSVACGRRLSSGSRTAPELERSARPHVHSVANSFESEECAARRPPCTVVSRRVLQSW